MQKNHQLTRLIVLTAFLWIGSSYSLAQHIIPIPLKMEQGDGVFHLSNETQLYTNLKGAEKKALTDYVTTLPSPFNSGFKSKKSTERNTISLLKTSSANTSLSAEAYELDVTPERTVISATTSSGLFYGLQSLLQLSQPAGESAWSVPTTRITDGPRFAYRGFMLDVSRHFRTKEFVKKQIDALARYKINRLHLHLTDGAGWRMEIKKFPRLTEFAAWRPEANWKQWWSGSDARTYCEQTDPRAQGGFYTQNDIRELVRYAAERHITIIPEIEMPAHSEEVLAAYPELSCAGRPYTSADYCVGNEKTFAFLEEVLTEVIALFPSEYIHIGGDEAGKNEWKTCPKCQQRMKDENLKDVNELQSYLIHRAEVFLNSKGRKLLGWDEIMEGGLAPNATVMSWRGEAGGINAVKAGHHAIMSPGSHCYIDGYQDAPYSQPEAIGGYLPLSKVYAYNPVPEALSAEEAKLIYGVQANLWAEYIESDKHCEYMIYPRILALAEVAWSQPERKDYNDFHARALKAVDWLQAKGYHAFALKDEIGNRPESKQPITHLATGKSVKYNTPYSPSYPAQGNATLTDGIRGSWTYSDGVWQGFIDGDRLDVTIDLKAETKIQTISAAFMQVVGPEVFLPAEVIISVSSNGVDFTELARLTHTVVKSDAVVFKDYEWNGTAIARYVRYQAHAGKAFAGWLFTDEIVIN